MKLLTLFLLQNLLSAGDYQKDGTADASADDCLKIQSPGLDYIYTGTFVLYKDKSFNFMKIDVYYGIMVKSSGKKMVQRNIQHTENAGDKIKMDRSGNFRGFGYKEFDRYYN